MIGQIGS